MTTDTAPPQVDAAPPTSAPLYLSRLILDPRDRAVQRDLADCRDLHRTVLRAFPDLRETPDTGDDNAPGDGAHGARRRFSLLYRLDESPSGRPIVLVQSGAYPDWGTLRGRSARYLLKEADIKDVAASYSALTAGQMLTFKLHANPTKKVDPRQDKDPERRNGRRVVLVKEEEQLAWIVRKGEQSGFDLMRRGDGSPTVQVSPVQRVVGHGPPDTRTFGAVTFGGVLRVTDANLLRAALGVGIGSGKAYGFGLLSLAPIRRTTP